MSPTGVMKRILPRRIYAALSILKNGAPRVPSMITEGESAFYAECARRSCGAEGAIVDLGCWMGSTSIALADGLSAAPPDARRAEKVLAFDCFRWEDWMAVHPTYGIYQKGDSFLPEARRIVRDHGAGLVELTQADLTRYEWPGGPIKLLLVDAMKGPQLTVQISRTFYPCLRPGAVLIHQDFKHFNTPWLHVLQYRLRDYFRQTRSVPGSGTVAFEVLVPVPLSDVVRATDFESVTDAETEDSFGYSLGLLEEAEKVNVAAAHVILYYDRNRLDKARETLARYAALGMVEKGDFKEVVRVLEARKET
jgi:hypothetical protein